MLTPHGLIFKTLQLGPISEVSRNGGITSKSLSTAMYLKKVSLGPLEFKQTILNTNSLQVCYQLHGVPDNDMLTYQTCILSHTPNEDRRFFKICEALFHRCSGHTHIYCGLR